MHVKYNISCESGVGVQQMTAEKEKTKHKYFIWCDWSSGKKKKLQLLKLAHDL